MNFDTVVTLIKKGESTTDKYGNAVYPETRTKIFAQKQAVRQSEFFQASAVGFKPEIMLEVNSFEYENQEFCELDGERFRIYRAYQKKGKERTELYLTAIVGDTNALA